MKDIENDLTPEEKKALDKVRAAAEAQASAEIAVWRPRGSAISSATTPGPVWRR